MNHCTKEELIAFERRIAGLWEAGELPYLIHLSGGNEEQLIQIFQEVNPGDWVFSSHRNHYHALLSGMDPARLDKLIRKGNSMFVYEKHRSSEIYGCDRNGRLKSEVNFISSSVLAGTCAIAAGVALQIKNENAALCRGAATPHVWCFIGDGAEDEGHFNEAARFVAGHNLPCTFVIEDNDRSVDSDKSQRWGDWPKPYTYCPETVRRYFYTPTYPHAGCGCKHHIEFRRGNAEG